MIWGEQPNPTAMKNPTTLKTALKIRPIEPHDLPAIASYWNGLNEKEMARIGVDPEKLPDSESIIQTLSNQLSLPIPHRNSYGVIWTYNGLPVGHSNTNPTQFGEEAWIHLHLWRQEFRGKGYGTKWMIDTIAHMAEALKLKKLIAEPKSDNFEVQGVLKNCGFELIKTHRTVPGSINFEQEVNRFELSLK